MKIGETAVESKGLRVAGTRDTSGAVNYMLKGHLSEMYMHKHMQPGNR